MSDPIATPTDLADLVHYQPGSVVSRVLMRNRGGVMTDFAFAQGEGLTEHISPHEASVLLLEGEADHRGRAGAPGRGGADAPPSGDGAPALHGDRAFKMLLTLLKEPR